MCKHRGLRTTNPPTMSDTTDDPQESAIDPDADEPGDIDAEEVLQRAAGDVPTYVDLSVPIDDDATEMMIGTLEDMMGEARFKSTLAANLAPSVESLIVELYYQRDDIQERMEQQGGGQP